MHGFGRMTVDPRIPTMLGRSTSGFHQPDRHCLHQARSAERCSASRTGGELHPFSREGGGVFRGERLTSAPCAYILA